MRVLQLGFGAVGRENIRQLLKAGYQLAAIVDLPEVLESIDLQELGFSAQPLPLLASDLAACLLSVRPDVVLQATAYDSKEILQAIHAAAAAGADLISINGMIDADTLEPELHEKIDTIAREAGIRVLGVGAIPGFFSDLLPLVLTGGCSEVEAIRFRRRSDYSKWGPAVARRYGFGLSPEEFDAATKSGSITLFKSLWQSAFFIARELRWPVVGEHEVK